ncbi:TetR/AcrR family transcriptional regulator [Capillimicrobium parvum]|uniref:TetR/AcrR family transcriptional regulator n=1 Tax=Capillimicrobium parvum TaxID=2884022 RepID=UPI003898EA77
MRTAGVGGGEARERIMAAAYELFSTRGVRAVGVDEIVATAGVARMTLYRHFGSKDDLVLAFLARREELWTDGWLRQDVERRAQDPADRLLAVFDVFDGWFREPAFEGCAFINVMLETTDAEHPAHAASVASLANIRRFLEGLAREAGVADPAGFARKWHILMKGSIVAAGEGDHDAALRAQEISRLVLADALGR